MLYDLILKNVCHVCLTLQEDCAQILLFRGADRYVKNYANQTAAEVAIIANSNHIADLINSFKPSDVGQSPRSCQSLVFLLHFFFCHCTSTVQHIWNFVVTHTHTRTNVLWPSWILFGTTRVSRHQKGNTSLDLLEQEIVSGNGISRAICKYAPWPKHITMPASHHSVFYRPDALSAAQPTASKHWRHFCSK